MELTAQLSLSLEQQVYANPRRMALLNCIVEAGSLSGGAKLAGMSYKAAWDAINDMNHRAEKPVLLLATGGKGGGGAQLTVFGERLVKLYQMLTDIQNRALNALQDETVPLDSLLAAISTFSAQSSARNQFIGRVSRIVRQPLHEVVYVVIGDAIELAAEVTHKSRERLQLSPGREVLLLVKAPAIRFVDGEGASEAVSTAESNHLQVKVVSVSASAAEQEVIVEAAEGLQLCAVTQRRIDLQAGQMVEVAVEPKQIVLAALEH
ncbi:TOBE domain-containing protein [Amphritea sp. 1_MG-2023]|uniref:TOBE domain-containing protein n=1 Tax=Amphritea sp. 1_MG-2023 TaxID=3062670 RepID=UPI0026E1651F|nr:TOBE domain-containing protein [Amphritea sp. 1_MG-2023]MDO6562178.1 TOBE domain-containing protein [Amphritea sp. 1_MG-2023]